MLSTAQKTSSVPREIAISAKSYDVESSPALNSGTDDKMTKKNVIVHTDKNKSKGSVLIGFKEIVQG